MNKTKGILIPIKFQMGGLTGKLMVFKANLKPPSSRSKQGGRGRGSYGVRGQCRRGGISSSSTCSIKKLANHKSLLIFKFIFRPSV